MRCNASFWSLRGRGKVTWKRKTSVGQRVQHRVLKYKVGSPAQLAVDQSDTIEIIFSFTSAERDAHITDLESKLGELHAKFTKSSELLRDHASRAQRLCTDIRSSVGAAPVVDAGDSQSNAGSTNVPSGSVQMFAAAVVERLEDLANAATLAAGAAEGDASPKNEDSDGVPSQDVSKLQAQLDEARAELARDEIIFASKNDEVLALQVCRSIVKLQWLYH